MTNEDVALFHRAEALANSGQTYAAHEMFCALQERNPVQVEVLFWVATTASDPVEARAAVETIRRLQPYHPRLKELERFHGRRLQRQPIGPALLCPYCGVKAPALVKSKIATGGWIWFGAWFVVSICFLFFILVPANQAAALGDIGIFCLIVGIVGLFVIRKGFYACSHCHARIAESQ